MKKFFQKYAILFFFCAMMGGIIMIDSILAISFTDKERGLATEFSDYTKKISILQADSSESFSQEDLMFLFPVKKTSRGLDVFFTGKRKDKCDKII